MLNQRAWKAYKTHKSFTEYQGFNFKIFFESVFYLKIQLSWKFYLNFYKLENLCFSDIVLQTHSRNFCTFDTWRNLGAKKKNDKIIFRNGYFPDRYCVTRMMINRGSKRKKKFEHLLRFFSKNGILQQSGFDLFKKKKKSIFTNFIFFL